METTVREYERGRCCVGRHQGTAPTATVPLLLLSSPHVVPRVGSSVVLRAIESVGRDSRTDDGIDGAL